MKKGQPRIISERFAIVSNSQKSYRWHLKVSKGDTKVIVDPGQDDLKYKKAHIFSDAGSFFPLQSPSIPLCSEHFLIYCSN